MGLLLVLPWLIPPYRPPSHTVLPWLLALACTALLVLLARPRLAGWLGLALLGAAGLAAVPVVMARDGLWLATAGALAIVALCAAAVQAHGPEGADAWAQRVAAAWLAAALVSAIIGLCQFFNLEQHVWFMAEAPGREPFGNLRQRNHYASLLSIGLAALLWLAHRYPMRGRAALVTLGAGLLLAAAQAVTGSRTGLVQLVLLWAAAAWWWRGDRLVRRLLLALPLAYAAATVLLPALAGLDPWGSGILARLQPQGPGCASRWTLWRDTWELALARPWTGWGWGELDYAHFVTVYAHPRHCELLDNAHNLFIHLAVELGLPVAALTALALAVLLWRQRQGLPRDARRQLGVLVFMLLLVHSLLEYPLWYGPFQMAAGLALGLMHTPTPGAAAPSWRGVQAGSASLLAVLMLVLGGWAAWDYLRTSQVFYPAAMRWAPYREQALAHAQRTWFFGPQARFAELSVTPLTPQTAARVHELALQALHYSPEPRVVEALIESAQSLGRLQEAAHYDALYRAAYPQAHARWQAERTRPPGL